MHTVNTGDPMAPIKKIHALVTRDPLQIPGHQINPCLVIPMTHGLKGIEKNYEEV